MQNTTTNQEFTFFIDQKISMWTRSTKHIQAQNIDEAETIIKAQYQNGELFEQNKKTYQNNKIMYESYNKLLSNELLEIIYHRIPSN